ncbi:hypothetical protein HFO58_10770 [Rhizobium leguminosarum]|uniref:hypothetical protein n=1 Tax=Rhizobium leguminosarum TaxID=384 RepID=UPI001C96C89B|nr:hypothetical protein [Rhizobium leguminosarum]MBY5533644.1 hypothetical protein [Rhizobium leguminosarum]
MKFPWVIRATAIAVTLNYCVANAQTTNSSPPATPAADVIAQLDALITSLKSLDSTSFQKIDGASKKAGELTERIYALDQNLSETADAKKASSIVKASEGLTGAIGSASPSVKALLQQTDAANEGLNNLLASIQTLALRPPGLVVRVNEAKFGDTYPDKYYIKRRWCDATAYMRARCDRKGTCSLEANYQDVVCGFNPAPSADLRDRGLFVDYQCVPNIEASFTGTYGPVRAVTPVLKKSRQAYVVLRGSGAIVCGVNK